MKGIITITALIFLAIIFTLTGCDKSPTIPDEPSEIICGKILTKTISETPGNTVITMIVDFEYECEGEIYITQCVLALEKQ